jgi:hypothetical protein
MSHHGNTDPEHEAAMRSAMRRLFGEFPDGKLNPDDAGAIAMSVCVEDKRVVLRFPKPVAWIGLTGDDAMGLAQLLITHARKAGITAPIVLRIGE